MGLWLLHTHFIPWHIKLGIVAGKTFGQLSNIKDSHFLPFLNGSVDASAYRHIHIALRCIIPAWFASPHAPSSRKYARRWRRWAGVGRHASSGGRVSPARTVPQHFRSHLAFSPHTGRLLPEPPSTY